MYYEGKIYRPWMEANSLMIQTTLGCTHNIVSSKGILPESQEQFLIKIDHAIARHPVTEQEVLKTSQW